MLFLNTNYERIYTSLKNVCDLQISLNRECHKFTQKRNQSKEITKLALTIQFTLQILEFRVSKMSVSSFGTIMLPCDVTSLLHDLKFEEWRNFSLSIVKLELLTKLISKNVFVEKLCHPKNPF